MSRSGHGCRGTYRMLLKLYAGGSQDRWDIEQLLALDGRVDVLRDVDTRIVELPRAARELWAQLRG